MTDLIGKTLGKYRLGNRIGRGGMSRVYRAYQPRLNRYVAVKVLHSHLASDAQLLLRFEREAAAVARLRHPNIIQVYDFDQDDQTGLYFMVMELIEGHSLQDEIRQRAERHELFSEAEMVEVMSPLASAIHYAHNQGMVHRDIKPSNILFDKNGQIVLTDFGLVFILGETKLTLSGMVSGTPYYLAPEQAQGERGDGRSDIYSLGVVLYEMATLVRPFESEQPQSVLVQHVMDAPQPPSELRADLSPELEKVILTSLAKQPAQRYQTAAAFAAALLEAVGSGSNTIPAWLINGLNDESTRVLSRDAILSSHNLPAVEQTSIRESPYRGLQPFREIDAPFFWGREEFVRKLRRRVLQRPLTAVVGPSGSGKTSAVLAGVVPQLRGDGGWLIATMEAGARPMQALADALLPLLEPELIGAEQSAESEKLAQALAAGDVELRAVVNRIAHKREVENPQPLLLVVDQFEGLYGPGATADARQGFFDHLVGALEGRVKVGRSELPSLKVVIIVRSECLGQVVQERELAPLLEAGILQLGALTHQEFAAVVVNPAAKQEARFESGLVERILDDVGAGVGKLPPLELVLTALWDRQNGGLLTHSEYEAIGRLEGVWVQYAEDVVGTLDAAALAQARYIFTQLVQPGEGSEDRGRKATRSELGEESWLLVQQLADARLLLTDGNAAGQQTAEITLEGLIHDWPRLREWMEADRPFRVWQERLRLGARQWGACGCDTGALLRGELLAEATTWMAKQPQAVVAEERAFVEASVAEWKQELAKQAHEAAALQRLQWLAWVGLAGWLVAGVLAVWLWLQ